MPFRTTCMQHMVFCAWRTIHKAIVTTLILSAVSLWQCWELLNIIDPYSALSMWQCWELLNITFVAVHILATIWQADFIFYQASADRIWAEGFTLDLFAEENNGSMFEQCDIEIAKNHYLTFPFCGIVPQFFLQISAY